MRAERRESSELNLSNMFVVIKLKVDLEIGIPARVLVLSLTGITLVLQCIVCCYITIEGLATPDSVAKS